jgi:hypothetical protein
MHNEGGYMYVEQRNMLFKTRLHIHIQFNVEQISER